MNNGAKGAIAILATAGKLVAQRTWTGLEATLI